MILIPKYQGVIDPREPIILPPARFSGEGRCILYDNDVDMNVIEDTGWFPNLITDNGLDILRSANSPYQRTYIGSGSTAATFGDTQMDVYLAETVAAGAGNAVRVAAITPDWEYSEVKSRRFAAGVGTGTIEEIAMGNSINDTGTDIFNRVVITPIVKSAIQVLDVLFRMTIWPPVNDLIGTGGTVSTIDGVSYETITRLLSVASQNGSNTFDKMAAIGGSGTWTSYDGNLGAITDGNPLGASEAGTGGAGLTASTYVPGNKFYDVTYDVGLDGWTTATDEIRSIRGAMNHYTFQTQFDATIGGAKIPKDGTKIMDFTWRMSWDRK